MTFIVKSVRNGRDWETADSPREAIAVVRKMQQRVRGAIRVEIERPKDASHPAGMAATAPDMPSGAS